MGTKKNKTISFFSNIVMMLVTLNSISQALAESSQILDKTKYGPAPTGTIKTIEVPEDGDMIDCVDIYKQPAFKDPLIKKDFQMISAKAYRSPFNKTKNLQSNIIFQNWNLYGDCPEGSIPIRRTWNNNRTTHLKMLAEENFKRDYAVARQKGSIYHGAAAVFNTWNPRVQENNEFSLTQLWVYSRRNPPRNTIECGWIVYPDRYDDRRTRLFTFWTNDDFNRTRCYDMDCAGFVQINRQWVLGGVLHVSTYEGPDQEELHVSVSRGPRFCVLNVQKGKSNAKVTKFQDLDCSYSSDARDPSGRWWIEIQGTKIGYFPSSRFPTLRYGADTVDFGGEIINRMTGNKHTSTEMGSGKFPHEAFSKASYMRNLQVINERHQTVDASLVESITRAECYDLDFGPPETSWGTTFFYGGPGFSEKCSTP